jgi:tryptophan synthase alpha subunit
MPFITAGFPSLDVTRQVAPRLETAGASAEIGFPFSIPSPTGGDYASMHRLQAGVTPADVFNVVREVVQRNLGSSAW